MLFFYCFQKFVRFLGAEAHGTDCEGIILDVTVEGVQDSPVHIFAVFDIHRTLLFVYRHLEHVFIVVEKQFDDLASFFCGGFLQHRFEF